jgi:hypothetical protein
MTAAAALIDRIAKTSRRLDLVADAALERARYDVREMRRADDAERDEERERIRRDRDRCIEHQSRYDEAFRKFGQQAPLPAADDHPPDYRRRLFGIGQSMLPRGHKFTKFDAREIDGGAIREFERQLLQALDEEAENPSGDNLPGPGEPLREVTKTDSATNERVTKFYGAESFIKGLSRPARRVLAFHDRDGRIIYPPRARGF